MSVAIGIPLHLAHDTRSPRIAPHAMLRYVAAPIAIDDRFGSSVRLAFPLDERGRRVEAVETQLALKSCVHAGSPRP